MLFRSRLYDFVLDRLLNANLKNDIKTFEEAERVLDMLRSGWKEMERGLSKSADMPMKENHPGMELRV